MRAELGTCPISRYNFFMKKIMMFIMGLMLFVFAAHPASGQADGECQELVSVCNQTLKDMAAGIEKYKIRHKELQGFDDHCILKDAEGFDQIVYADPRSSYGFTLKFLPIDAENPFSDDGISFVYELPLLELKLVGFVTKGRKYSFFNPEEYWDDWVERLQVYQQKFLPYQFILNTDKEMYLTNEPIYLTVTITNTSDRILRFKDLNEQTVFFMYDGAPWGVRRVREEAKSVETIFLNPGRSFIARFQGEAFRLSKEDIRIKCVYALPFKGVRPLQMIRFSVQRPGQ